MAAVGDQRAFRETDEFAGFITVVDEQEIAGRQYAGDSFHPVTYFEARFQSAATRDCAAESPGILQERRGRAPRSESNLAITLVNEQFQPLLASFLHQVNGQGIEEFICENESRPVLRKRHTLPIVRTIAESP